MKAQIYVTLKNGILDPQGQEVGKTLHRLGFDEVERVRVGKFVEINLKPNGGEDAALVKARVEEMCRKLVANTVIEDFVVELDELSEEARDEGENRA